MGAQLTATHMQREARGEQGQRCGVGAAEGPGRRLAHGLLGRPRPRSPGCPGRRLGPSTVLTLSRCVHPGLPGQLGIQLLPLGEPKPPPSRGARASMPLPGTATCVSEGAASPQPSVGFLLPTCGPHYS